MGAQQGSALEALSNSPYLVVAHFVPLGIAQETEYAGSSDDRVSGFGRETDKYISREEWSLQLYDPVGPLRLLCVERHVVLQGPYRQVLGYLLLVVSHHVENMPWALMHRFPQLNSFNFNVIFRNAPKNLHFCNLRSPRSIIQSLGAPDLRGWSDSNNSVPRAVSSSALARDSEIAGLGNN
jgi:hypothetical protein